MRQRDDQGSKDTPSCGQNDDRADNPCYESNGHVLAWHAKTAKVWPNSQRHRSRQKAWRVRTCTETSLRSNSNSLQGNPFLANTTRQHVARHSSPYVERTATVKCALHQSRRCPLRAHVVAGSVSRNGGMRSPTTDSRLRALFYGVGDRSSMGSWAFSARRQTGPPEIESSPDRTASGQRTLEIADLLGSTRSAARRIAFSSSERSSCQEPERCAPAVDLNSPCRRSHELTHSLPKRNVPRSR